LNSATANRNGHENGNGGYGQGNIYGSPPFLDPIIIEEWASLDELLVNRANKEAKIFRV
jgi:hypothetical protein